MYIGEIEVLAARSDVALLENEVLHLVRHQHPDPDIELAASHEQRLLDVLLDHELTAFQEDAHLAYFLAIKATFAFEALTEFDAPLSTPLLPVTGIGRPVTGTAICSCPLEEGSAFLGD